MKISKISKLKKLINEIKRKATEKRFINLLNESDASEKAHQKGLKSAGFGNWKDKSGKVVAQTKDGKLVPVKKSKSKDFKAGNKEDVKPEKSPDTSWKGKKAKKSSINVTKKDYKNLSNSFDNNIDDGELLASDLGYDMVDNDEVKKWFGKDWYKQDTTPSKLRKNFEKHIKNIAKEKNVKLNMDKFDEDFYQALGDKAYDMYGSGDED